MFQTLTALKLTANAPENRPFAPKGNSLNPNINFQRFSLLVFGSVWYSIVPNFLFRDPQHGKLFSISLGSRVTCIYICIYIEQKTRVNLSPLRWLVDNHEGDEVLEREAPWWSLMLKSKDLDTQNITIERKVLFQGYHFEGLPVQLLVISCFFSSHLRWCHTNLAAFVQTLNIIWMTSVYCCQKTLSHSCKHYPGNLLGQLISWQNILQVAATYSLLHLSRLAMLSLPSRWRLNFSSWYRIW